MLSDDQLKALEPVDVELEDTVTTTADSIDLSGYGAAHSSYSLGSGADTITITGLDYSALNNISNISTTITLPTPTINNYTISNGATGATYSNSSYNWSGISSSPPNVVIDSDGIDVKEKGDIKIKGRSLSEFMSKMEQRMAILVPDPEKLEKFEALKKAYEHYKTMEALCFPDKDEEK